MNLLELKAINSSSINAAGPRYSPVFKPGFPSLQIPSLESAIEAIALTDKYRFFIVSLEKDISESWDATPESIKNLFPIISPEDLSVLLLDLKEQQPGESTETARLISLYCEKFSLILQKESQRILERNRYLKEDSKEKHESRSKLFDMDKLDQSLGRLRSFINTPNFKLTTNNLMILLGEWGTGKTHLLCDVVQNRMSRDLPTLFFLANRLQPNKNPLSALCQSTGIAASPKELLDKLDKLGKDSGTRALLIIDGINELDRVSWKKYLLDIASMAKSYKNIGLILSCRSPFDRQIFNRSLRRLFVRVNHNGFKEIEFDAQSAFFNYYKIPLLDMPLLTPEFSRPLFLKILCETFSGQTSTSKNRRWIKKIGSGQKSMTKLFEDFAIHVGSKIELDFGLSKKKCWKILKGCQASDSSGNVVGVSVLMADLARDYITTKDCISIIMQATGKSPDDSLAIFNRMVGDGLLSEDIIWDTGVEKTIVKFPYQRFSDHLIARHLLDKYLDASSELTIRESFQNGNVLGEVFTTIEHGNSYLMPGLASAIMLEFPERVKKVLPINERELLLYLPKKSQLREPFTDAFFDGIMWRDRGSFCEQTDIIFGKLLDSKDAYTKYRTFEVLMILGCRTDHPYSARKLYYDLSNKTVHERDLSWSEFLRNTQSESVVYRLLNWVDDFSKVNIDKARAENSIELLSLLLTTTHRPLRDRATKALVLIGERQPSALFEKTIQSLGFNDPYLPERMLAASYGLLMRSWAFPSKAIKDCVSDFACSLYDSIFATDALYSTSHILSRDYALGIIELAQIINSGCLGERELKNLKIPFQPPVYKIPDPSEIEEEECKPADSAIHMDFGNYTLGRLVSGRHNYDYDHEDYVGIKRQIRWRILNLGYSSELFKEVDSSISEMDFYQEKTDGNIKIDRYGKKYSWIGYFEVAGLLANKGLLPERYYHRVSDCDIDPSFPETLKVWNPPLGDFFDTPFKTAVEWAECGKSPSYDHLLQIDEVDGISGPWVLLGGYLSESSSKDPRKVSTFISGVLVNESNISKLNDRFSDTDYPGNSQIPEPWEDYYTFVGEVPWSEKYGSDFYELAENKIHVSEAFEGNESFVTRKKAEDLSESERFSVSLEHNGISYNDTIEGMTKTIDNSPASLPEYVEFVEYRKVPGVPVEIPVHRLSWESYHSKENQGGTADFVAPAICDMLQLKNKGNSQDLFDSDGNQASVFRVFGGGSEYIKSSLLYIRKDLLEKYLVHTNQKLVWLMWGERDFKINELEPFRAELRDTWDKHMHIHKQIKVYET